METLLTWECPWCGDTIPVSEAGIYHKKRVNGQFLHFFSFSRQELEDLVSKWEDLASRRPEEIIVFGKSHGR